mmetsp:Transcript_2282/g.4608  ORF Transcript_2282/g.4608 Transcript_2282/m.4608 type:complete len:81 (-) Transcript_2282:106-348(-)
MTSTSPSWFRGTSYALTVQAAPGVGIAPPGHGTLFLEPEVASFRGAVLSRAPWRYPVERDDDAWELAYVNLVTLYPLPRS